MLLDVTVPGGINQFDNLLSPLPPAVDAFCCGGFGTTDGALQRHDGMTLDAGVEADYFLAFTNGTESVGDPAGPTSFWALTAHYAEMNQGETGRVVSAGLQLNPFGTEPGLVQGGIVDQTNNGCTGPDDRNCMPPEHEFAEPVDSIGDPTNTRNHRDMENSIDLRMAIDNSNVAGVNGSGGPDFGNTGDPENVTTGVEFSIPLSQIGNPAPGTDIKAVVFINGGGLRFRLQSVRRRRRAAGEPGGPILCQPQRHCRRSVRDHDRTVGWRDG